MSNKTNEIIINEMDANRQVVLDIIKNDKTEALKDACAINKQVKEMIVEVLKNPNADEELKTKVFAFIDALPDPELCEE